MKLKQPGGEWSWVVFLYEKLPTFCLYCGILGHSDKFCEKLYARPGVGTDRAYGAYLRAQNSRSQSQIGETWLCSSTPVTSTLKASMVTPTDPEPSREENQGRASELDGSINMIGDMQTHMASATKGRILFPKLVLPIIPTQNQETNASHADVSHLEEVIFVDPKRRRMDEVDWKLGQIASSS